MVVCNVATMEPLNIVMEPHINAPTRQHLVDDGLVTDHEPDREPIERAAVGVHDDAFRLLRSVAAPQARVIDMGTGQGALARRMASVGFVVTAVDINSEDYRLANEIEYVACDFNDVSSIRALALARTHLYDIAMSVEVIEHLENPWEYARNLRRLLKTDGLLILTSPNPAAWHSRLTFLRRGEFDDFGSRGQAGHVNPIAPWEMTRILTDVGFEILLRGASAQVYSAPTWKQRALQVGAHVLRPFQQGQLDGFCQIILAKRLP